MVLIPRIRVMITFKRLFSRKILNTFLHYDKNKISKGTVCYSSENYCFKSWLALGSEKVNISLGNHYSVKAQQ